MLDFEQRRWSAPFVWLPEEEYPAFQKTNPTYFCDKKQCHYGVALFRKTFFLNAAVKKAYLRVSASVKYRLYLNESFLGRGPIAQGGDYGNTDLLDYWFYDVITDTRAFHPGMNCLAAQVSLQTGIKADYSLGWGGFTFDLDLELENGEQIHLRSDNTVRCTLDRGAKAPGEQNDCLSPVGWKKTEFDDSGWHAAQYCREKVLIESPIPPLQEQDVYAREIKPANLAYGRRMHSVESLQGENGSMEIEPGSPLTFVMDFGRVEGGRVRLSASGAPGTIFFLHFGEIEGRINSPIQYVLGASNQEFENWVMQSVQYLTVTVANFTGPVKIEKLCLHTTNYPVTQEGNFRCSDPELDRIYEAGKHTLKICRQDYHLDSPKHQEPLGCTGDYMIESLMNYYTFGDARLTRLDIWRTAQMLRRHQGFFFHTSYSLLYLSMIRDYYLYTGDLKPVRDAMDVIHLLLERFDAFLGDNGVLESVPNFMFIDWVPVGKYNLHHPPRALGQAALTAFYYGAVQAAVQLFDAIGDTASAAFWKEKAEILKHAFHTVFWREKAGLYCDGIPGKDELGGTKWRPQNPDQEFYSQHTNSLAVLYGLAPEQKSQDIMQRVISDDTLIQAQPYFMHFVLNALDTAGMFETNGIEQMYRWSKLLEECPGSLKEVWSGFDCDYSHAWGGTPTYQLPAKVLGVVPLVPGMKKICIRPQLGLLEWAKGAIPTPSGMLKIFVERKENQYLVKLQLPNGIEWEAAPNVEIVECENVHK